MRSLARAALLFALTAALTACSWQVRASRAAGLCPDRAVVISDARGNEWIARCENRIGSYGCMLIGGSVQCEYLPICGNDRHSESHTAAFTR